MSQKYVGLKGDVYLLSPDKKKYIKIHLPGRRIKWNYVGSGKYKPAGIEVEAYGDMDRKNRERRQKRFQKLLSQGWTVVSPAELEKSFGPEWKKFTDKVDGSTKTGSASHGGDHASGEVEDSPNAAPQGKKYESRGQRGARKKKPSEDGPAKRVKMAMQRSNQHVWSPQPMVVSKKTIESARASAELLCQIVGQSEQKIRKGVDVDPLGLMMAFEKGENPLPYLDMPQEQSKVRVFLTNDESGSCQSFSGLTKGWACTLAKLRNVDAFYAKNANGSFGQYGENKTDEWYEKLLETMDFIVYLGDGDAWYRMIGLANKGAKVIYLSCASCNYGSPRLRGVHHGSKGGVLYEIDRVSNGSSESWYTALKLVLGC